MPSESAAQKRKMMMLFRQGKITKEQFEKYKDVKPSIKRMKKRRNK